MTEEEKYQQQLWLTSTTLLAAEVTRNGLRSIVSYDVDLAIAKASVMVDMVPEFCASRAARFKAIRAEQDARDRGDK